MAYFQKDMVGWEGFLKLRVVKFEALMTNFYA